MEAILISLAERQNVSSVYSNGPRLTICCVTFVKEIQFILEKTKNPLSFTIA